MGIYDKACPQCTATNSAGAMRCVCGYLFDSTHGHGSESTPQRVADEERLFEEYLEARVRQALESARVAAHAAEIAPDNDRKAIEALRAKQAADVAEAELAVQRVRAAMAADAARREAKRTPRETPLAKHNGVANGAIGLAPVTPARGLEVTYGTDDDDLHKEYLMARAARTTKLAPTKQATSSQVPTIQSKAPGKAFRAAQAAKAARAMRAGDTRRKRHCPWCSTSIPVRAERCLCGWSHTVTLGEEADSADLEPTLFDKVCPQCGATIYVAATRCTCGYVFGFRRAQGSRANVEQAVEQEKARATPMVRNARVQSAVKAIRPAAVKMRNLAHPASPASQRSVSPGGQVHKKEPEVRVMFKAPAARRARRVTNVARAAFNKQRKSFMRRFKQVKIVRVSEAAKTWQAAITTPAAKATKAVLTAAAQTATNVVRAAQDKTRKRSLFAAKHVSQAIKNTHDRRKKKPRALLAGSRRKRPTLPVRAAANATNPEQRRNLEQTGRSSKAAKIAKAVIAARALDTAKDIGQAGAVSGPDTTMECPLCTARLRADATHCACGWLIPAAQREVPVLVTREARPAEDIETFNCPIECPVCTATIPAGVRRCGCGWLVPKIEREMPPLMLSAEERTALAQGVHLKKSH